MNAASRVRIAKLKIGKNKFGMKVCEIELRRSVDESDHHTPHVEAAIQHMNQNEKCTKIDLGLEMRACSLAFYGSPTSEPSDRFPSVEVWKFKLKRERGEITLSFSFVTLLEDARRWLIPSIGDEILCVIEDAQMSFKNNEAS